MISIVHALMAIFKEYKIVNNVIKLALLVVIHQLIVIHVELPIIED